MHVLFFVHAVHEVPASYFRWCAGFAAAGVVRLRTNIFHLLINVITPLRPIDCS